MKTLLLIWVCLALLVSSARGQVSGGVSRSVVTNILKTNASILMMSPAGGNNQISDMLSSIPAFDGQFGESYAAGGGRNQSYLWAARNPTNGVGTNSWGLGMNFPGGIRNIGDNTGNSPLLGGGGLADNASMRFNWNYSPAKMTKGFVYNSNTGVQSDDILYVINYNPYASGDAIAFPRVGTNPIGNVILTNSDGVPVYMQEQFGFTLNTIPDSDPVGETNLAGSYDLIIGSGYWPFYFCGNWAYNGGPLAQRSWLIWSPEGLTNSTKFAGIRVPRWVANAFAYTNQNYLDAFTVNVLTGDVNVASNFFAFRGKFTNDLEIGMRTGEDTGHGFDCNTNASFNATTVSPTQGAAWCFDALSSHRVGFLIQNGQYPKLAHAQNAPFTFTRTSTNTDLLSNSSTNAATDELVIDPTGNVIVTNGGTFVLSGNINVPKTVSATTGAQTINKISGSVIFAASAQTIVVTDSLVDTNSIVIATVYDDDTTAKSCIAKGASGSFTLKLNAAATAQCRVNFLVTN